MHQRFQKKKKTFNPEKIEICQRASLATGFFR